MWGKEIKFYVFSTLFAGVFLFPTLNAYDEAREITIGVIAPLSGDVAPWGEDVRNALLFAQSKLRDRKVTFVFEDDRCLGRNAATAAQKLISIDHVDFGMVICTESMLSSAPIFEKAKVPVMSPVASGMTISKAGDYIFRTWPNDSNAGELLYRYLSSKHKSCGVVSEERGYSEELKGAFQQAAHGGALNITTEVFTSETADFRSVLIRLKKEQVESIFINTNSERTFANILKQLRELGIHTPVYGVYIPGNKAFVELAGELANGVIFVDGPSTDSALSPEGQPLYQQFISQYGPMKSSSFVFPATFEAFRLVQLAANSGKDPRDFWYHGQFTGIFGTYTFDRNGDIEGIHHVLKVIENRQSKLLNWAK